MVALLEEASLHNDEATQRELLTFVTAGGGFAGAETTGAVNDFLRETARFYPASQAGDNSHNPGSRGANICCPS